MKTKRISTRKCGAPPTRRRAPPAGARKLDELFGKQVGRIVEDGKGA